jgi:hypothetical protein
MDRNRNIGVLNTTVAEVVTVDAHKRKLILPTANCAILTFLARGFSIMPLVWCLG